MRHAAHGLGELAHLDSELGHTRSAVDVAAGIAKILEAARQRSGGGPDQRRGEGAQEGDGQKRELEAGVEHLLRVEHQEAERHCGQQVEGSALAIEIARYQDQRQARGGARARRQPARQQGVEPRRHNREQQRHALGNEAHAQEEEEKSGQDGDVRPGDHQGVEGAGLAVILGPDALELKGLADHEGLHHPAAVSVAGVETLNAGQNQGAKVHHGLLKWRAAMAGQDADRRGGAGCRPEDVLARQVAGVVESAGVAVVARFPNARVELNVLAVAQRRERLVSLGVESNLRAGVRIEFQQESFARAGDGGRLHHAAAEDDDFAPFGIELGRRSGGVGEGRERAGEEESQAAAGARQQARAAVQGHHAEHQEGADGEKKLGWLERYETGNQDPRGNGGQRPDQWILHGTPIVPYSTPLDRNHALVHQHGIGRIQAAVGLPVHQQFVAANQHVGIAARHKPVDRPPPQPSLVRRRLSL